MWVAAQEAHDGGGGPVLAVLDGVGLRRLAEANGVNVSYPRAIVIIRCRVTSWTTWLEEIGDGSTTGCLCCAHLHLLPNDSLLRTLERLWLLENALRGRVRLCF